MRDSVQMVTLWGKEAPPHSITAILITDDQRTIVTGSHEGQVCLWDLLPDLQMSSRQMLLGHTASVMCLAKARDFEKQLYVVSATENGEMSIWDITSGRCVENTRLPFRHTAICYYHSSFRMAGEGWLVCCGQYNDILIIDAITLVVLHTLTSSSSSDWISCMCLVHSLRIQEDSLLAVSAAGDLKAWDLSSSISKIQEKQNVSERECQPLGCTLCNAIRFCTYTERLLLVVFSTCWKVYDYCDFCLLWTEFSPSSQTLAGGEILAAHRLIIWTEDGHGYIYQLVNSGLSRSIQPSKGRVLKETVHPVLLSSTEVQGNKSFSYIMGFMNERKEPFYKILYSGQASGRITLWHVPDVPVSTLDGSPKVIPVAASRTLQDNFNIYCPIAEGIPDHPWGVPITVSTYIPSLQKLVCGYKDGRIITVPALHAAKARLLGEGSVQKDDAAPCVLSSGSSVTALLVLPGRPAPCWLLSGSRDSCVIWWDIFTGEALHRFALDAGPVDRLLLSPDSCRRKGHRLVCCVCSDHSVVLLHVQERACLMRARKHLFPVTALRWHPMENLLVVGCENDSVYVWDIETGSLERHESGETAKAILASCEDSGLMADPLYAAWEEDGQREKDLGGSLSSSSAFGSFSCNRLAHQRRSFCRQLTTLCWAQGPFAVWPLRATWESISVNMLLFDLEGLVELLCSSQANGLKSSNSFSTIDTLKRARNATEKRTLMLQRNRTSGSLFPVDGQVRAASEEQDFGEVHTSGTLEQSDGIKRRKKAKSSKKIKRQSSRKPSPTVATEAAKLLLSCFFPWGVNRELDGLCVQYLGILRLFSPVSFGLLSKNNYLTLMLPGWNSANPERMEKQQEAVNLFSSKVLHLHSKYYSVTQEQAGKKNGWRNTVTSTEQRLVLAYLLSRMSLVQRIINRPSEKSSLMKRNKWRPAASLVLDDLNLESSPHILRFPVCEADNRSFVKLISCWRDQSIEVMEATQATLLAEVEQSMQQKTLAGGCGQTNSTRWGSAGAKNPPSLGTMGMINCESCITTPNVEDGEGSAEELGVPGVNKPLPWISKLCSCKVC
ncbi:WD repeat-containing protein 72 isoform X2 [Pantherophis guttatus]|uniref:WD repeat-containing protein 72 isoform X2 n=1 Tax=Pantherophis guttatus TaxID=94885 RepID=A0A6P9B9G4_PANGU|nr:WD repeat-containing protein 72 isoform X2 [Pantherophis guttatus]